jgi:hypothetical protein
MDGAAVYTVDTEKLELIFTIQSNEVVVQETLLWHLILVRDSVEVQACAKVILS